MSGRGETGPEPHRAGAIAGVVTFVLAVLLLLLFVSPEMALLGGLASGMAAGGVVLAWRAVAGIGAAEGRPAVARPGAAPEAPAAEAADTAPAAPSRDLTETARLSPEEVLRAADLHQTIRLDQAGLDIVLPEVSPESVLRDREGIDEAFLRAGLGIEEGPTASENVAGPQAGPEESR